MRGSREISLVPSLHRASTDALIKLYFREILGIDPKQENMIITVTSEIIIM